MKLSAPIEEGRESKTLGIKEASQYLLLHEQTLLARARAGRIPGAAKPGKRWVFLEEGLREYLLSLSPYRSPEERQEEYNAFLSRANGGVTKRREREQQEAYEALLGLPTKRRGRKGRTSK